MGAISDKKLSSAVGFRGICRKVLIFILVGIANVIDINVLGQVGVLRTAVIFFYISNEGLSLIENAAHLGLPIPGKLKEVLEQLHNRDEKTRIRRKNNMAIKGIDVSVWQGAIDFNAVRNSGVDFVIIRAGYGTNSKDKYFEENYRKAKAAELHVGAYWYSYADSFSEAVQEAEMFLSTLAGKQFDYPVFLDMEEKSRLKPGLILLRPD